MIRYFLLTLLLFLMAGCTTVSANKLGISATEWGQYSPQQRESIIKDYQVVQKERLQAESITRTNSNNQLQVTIKGGKLMMPPFTDFQAYQPISFIISEGQCTKEVTISQLDNPQQKTSLGVCYIDNNLYLDPSRYDVNQPYGSITFPFIPVWKRGFTYPNVSITGYAKLTKVSVSLKLLNNNGQH